MKKITLFLATILFFVLCFALSACDHKHEFGPWEKTEPTCLTGGYEERVCQDPECGAREKQNEVDPLGHEMGEWIRIAPTCTQDGLEERECTRCGERETGVLEAKGHDFGEWTQTKAPTCAEAGIEEKKCSRCAERETKEVPATGHTFDEWSYMSPPDCTNVGIEESWCSVCGKNEWREVPELGHDIVNEWCQRCHRFLGEGLKFTSNGDGTCYVSGIGALRKAEHITVPEYSPEGDLVVGIRPEDDYLDGVYISMTIPDSVTYIACGFSPSLQEITFGENSKLQRMACTFMQSALKSIHIPSSVTFIGDNAFMECSLLESVTFGENSQLEWLGLFAFAGCTSLKSIQIPEGVTELSNTFERCESLTSIHIPDSVTFLQDTFGHCTSLAEVTFGDNSALTRIEYGVFAWCTSLKSITIPKSVELIQDSFFESGLEHITVLGGYSDNLLHELLVLGDLIQVHLKSITIHLAGTRPDIGMILKCKTLEDVYFVGTKEELEKISRAWKASGSKVPDGLTAHYIEQP